MQHASITELVKANFSIDVKWVSDPKASGLNYLARLLSPAGVETATSTGSDPVRALDNLSDFITNIAAKEFVSRCRWVDAPGGDRDSIAVSGEILNEQFPGILKSPSFQMYLLQYAATAIENLKKA